MQGDTLGICWARDAMGEACRKEKYITLSQHQRVRRIIILDFESQLALQLIKPALGRERRKAVGLRDGANLHAYLELPQTIST